MPGWDYSRNGYYFVTPVILYMKCLLGKIENGKMIFSDFGKIVNDEWHKSFEIRKELFLDEFTIMPNHLHAILIIKHPEDDNLNADDDVIWDNNVDEIENEIWMEIGNDENGNDENGNDENGNVQTHGRASLASPHAQFPHAQPSHAPSLHCQPKSISSFMAGFKSATTTKIDDYIDLHHLPIAKFNRKNRLWQINYHDRIIRYHREYLNIKNYIRNNPRNWDEDKLRTKH